MMEINCWIQLLSLRITWVEIQVEMMLRHFW